MTDVRERMFELTNEVIGLGFGRSSREAYLDLVAPGEAEPMRTSLGKASSCGLVVRGLWGRLGLDDPRLRAPYKVGSVLATIVDMAREADARRGAAWEQPDAPRVGDVLLVDIDTPRAHVATVVGVLGEGADGNERAVYSVDGGQREAGGAEVVLRRRRVLTFDGDGIAWLAPGDAYGQATRKLSGIVDLEALAAHFLPGGAS